MHRDLISSHSRLAAFDCHCTQVGPAFYNVDASALKGTRATNFGASKSERVAIKAQADNQETPGPGQYNDAAEPAAVRRQHSKPSATPHRRA